MTDSKANIKADTETEAETDTETAIKTDTEQVQLAGGSCPLPAVAQGEIELGHGSGGRLSQGLIEKYFVAPFDNPFLKQRGDAAVCPLGNQKMAFTTDSYVVKPIFFPGGDIGKLAVCGTVNDLAMVGAVPQYLSASFILEEGFPLEWLERITRSMQETAAAAGVDIVTGDTKVVDRGHCDGVFINTAGVGLVSGGEDWLPAAIAVGDNIILSNDIGRHGMAVLLEREGLNFTTTIRSDVAPLNGVVNALLAKQLPVHCLRDLTRGGLASGLVELAETRGVTLNIEEACIPVQPPVQSACELLGFDPLHVANEGCFIAFVPAAETPSVLALLKGNATCQSAAVIGSVAAEGGGLVTMKNSFGVTGRLEMLTGEQLPRIC